VGRGEGKVAAALKRGARWRVGGLWNLRRLRLPKIPKLPKNPMLPKDPVPEMAKGPRPRAGCGPFYLENY